MSGWWFVEWKCSILSYRIAGWRKDTSNHQMWTEPCRIFFFVRKFFQVTFEIIPKVSFFMVIPNDHLSLNPTRTDISLSLKRSYTHLRHSLSSASILEENMWLMLTDLEWHHWYRELSSTPPPHVHIMTVSLRYRNYSHNNGLEEWWSGNY